MATLSQSHRHPCTSGIAPRSCVQSAPAPGSRIVYGLRDNRKSAAGCRLGALDSELIHRPLRITRSRSNDRCVGQFTAGKKRCVFVCACRSYQSSEKSSGITRDVQVDPRARQNIQEEDGKAVAASGNPAWRTLAMHTMGVFLAGSLVLGVSSADAVDALKTCACLLKECRLELARCITNPACAANVACLQTCNNRPDETECQIGCGDLFENSAVDQFNECAVTRKGCVPQKVDDGKYPIPPPETLVKNFDPREMTGQWYITSGLNKTFDTFDCQLHEFTGRENDMTAKLTWRIQTPDGGFFTRSALQNFVQDKRQPGLFLNHGNEFLHYKDDWYILSAKMDHSVDDYMFVYYRGSNDAWDGYGGAVIYTRSSKLPASIIPELDRAAKSIGLNFDKFITTDNTCGAEAPLFARLEKAVETEGEFIAEEAQEEESIVVQGLKQVVSNVGQFLANILNGEIKFFDSEVEEARKEEEYILKQLGDEEKALLDDLNIGARDFVRLFGKPVPLRKLK